MHIDHRKFTLLNEIHKLSTTQHPGAQMNSLTLIYGSIGVEKMAWNQIFEILTVSFIQCKFETRGESPYAHERADC